VTPQDCINEEITPDDLKKFNDTSAKLANEIRGQFDKAIEAKYFLLFQTFY